MLIVETTEARQHLSLHGLNSVWTNQAKHAVFECVPAAHDSWSSYKTPHRLTCTIDVSQNEIPLTQLVSSLNSTQRWDHFRVSTWMLFSTEVVIKMYHKSVSWGPRWYVREWETRRATPLFFVLLIDFHRQLLKIHNSLDTLWCHPTLSFRLNEM